MRWRPILIGAGVVVGLPVLGVLGWVAVNWAPLSSFPSMPSAYEAKEMCSCLFVEGRDQEFCDRFVFQDVVPSQGREVDLEGRRVTARALWRTHSARWVSAEYGCAIE